MKIGVALGAVALVLAAAGLWLWHGESARLMHVVAVKMPNEDKALAIYFTLENPGAPLRIEAASSPWGEAALAGAKGALVVPGGSSALFASDGAHLRISGLDEAPVAGLLVPFALELAGGETLRAKARIAPVMGDMMMEGSEGKQEVTPVLSAEMLAGKDPLIVQVAADPFTFAPQAADMRHRPGEGHGHLYLNGLKLQRLYEPRAEIGPLLPGEYLLEVTLNRHDHKPYMAGGAPISVAIPFTY